MEIEIISDTVCPWCFIGKRRLERALALRPQDQLRVGWRPFQLNPDMPPEGMDRRDYMGRKFGQAREADIHKALNEAGAAEGIAFNFPAIKRMPNTLASHRLLRYGGEQDRQDAVAEALFEAFFVEGKDIGDRATLVEIGAKAGLEPAALAAYLESGRDLETVRSEDELARRMGVNGVPTFVFERKYVISGAQPPETLLQIFDHLAAEAQSADAVAGS